MSEIISQFSLASWTGSNISYATLASWGWRRVTQRRKIGFRDHGQLDVRACLRQPKVAKVVREIIWSVGQDSGGGPAQQYLSLSTDSSQSVAHPSALARVACTEIL